MKQKTMNKNKTKFRIFNTSLKLILMFAFVINSGLPVSLFASSIQHLLTQKNAEKCCCSDGQCTDCSCESHSDSQNNSCNCSFVSCVSITGLPPCASVDPLPLFSNRLQFADRTFTTQEFILSIEKPPEMPRR